MRPTRLACAAVAFAIGLGLLATAAFAASSGRHAGIKEGGTLLVNISTSDVQSIDPAIDYEFLGWPLEAATCMKLVNYPDKPMPQAAVLYPEAAKAMPRVSADGKTYTFTIRPGFLFSPPSSQPVTAQTFKGTIERAMYAVKATGHVARLRKLLDA